MSSIYEAEPTTAGQPARRRSRTPLVAVAVAAGVVVVGGAAAAYAAVGGGGQQPEDVTPASAVAFAKIDLDPSAGQKANAFRLAQKFPDSGVTDEDSSLDDLLADVFDDTDVDVRSWIGQRVGVAVFAGTSDATLDDSDPSGPLVAIVAQVEDEDAMRSSLRSSTYKVKIVDDYAVLSEDQSVLDLFTGSGDMLADGQYTEDVDSLDDGVATGWVDLDRVAELDTTGSLAGAGKQISGRAAAVLSVGSDHVDLSARTFDMTADGVRLDGDLAHLDGLPGTSDAAVALHGLGAALSATYTQDEDTRSLVDGLGVDAYGLSLPGDFTALLGDEVEAGFTADGSGVVEVHGGDAARAQEVTTVNGLDQTAVVEPTEDGFRLLFSGGTAGTGLTDDEAFTKAVPDAGSAQFVAFADLQPLLESFGGSDEDTAALGAVGVSSSIDDDGNGSARLRLTFN